MKTTRRKLCRALACASFGTALAAAHADVVELTYTIDASAFQNSNGVAPPAPATNSVSGTVTFTVDTAAGSQTGIVPDAVTGIAVRGFDGTLTDYNPGNSGVDAALNAAAQTGRITFGGTTSGIPFMVGISNDMRVIFDISLVDFSVTGIVGGFVYVTTSTAFYTSTVTDIALLSAVVVVDTDGDSIPDSADNCQLVANADQRDSDGDGYGNLCDADFNQDCIVNASDLGIMKINFFATGDLATDLDGDGVTNVTDLGLLKTLFFSTPGPSGSGGSC